jgi:ABC-type transport system involved in multi-copper enzyme maturation permease subunit
LAPPRRSQLAAVLWKQLRETGPFVMLGVAAIIGSSMLMFQLSVNQGRNGEFSNILLGMCGYLGFFIVIVAGIGVLLDDLKPGLHTFWRSRPINPDLWFWTKFLTGLTTTTVALGIPLLLALWFMPEDIWQNYHELLSITPTLFLSIYCFAVVAIALVRRPIYAAIFAIGLIAFCSFTIERLLPRSFEFHAEAVCVMATVLSFLATLSAWLAVRYDIGYKG